MKRRVLSLVLALAVIVSITVIPAAAADEASQPGNWYDGAMSTWSDRGVLQGDQAGNLNPTANITRAELAVMLDRIMDYRVKASNSFADVEDGAWYADAVLKASAAGVLQGDGVNANPGAAITRQETMVMLARVLNLSGSASDYASYTDAGQVAGWAAQGVGAMVAGGYVQGSGGYLNPAANITRAEVATILDNVFQGYFAQAGTYNQSVEGSAVINTGSVTLSGLTVSGDLIVAEGVGDGHVVLDGVTVTGRLLIRGGGANSVIIKNNCKIDTVILSRQDGQVRLAVQGSSAGQVSLVYVADGSDRVKLEGSVDTLVVEAADTKVEVAGTVAQVELAQSAESATLTVASGAKVDSLTNAAPDSMVNVQGTVAQMSVAQNAAASTVQVAAGAKVDSLTTAADNFTLSGSGTVSAMTVTSGSGVTVSASTTVTKADNQSENSVALGDKELAAGQTGSNTGTTTGGGSTGGGSTGGGSTPVSTYTVTFYDGETALADPAPQTVNSGSAATDPGPVEKAGYTWNFWSESKDGSAAYDFATPITADKGIYAIRTPIQYTITYNLNGGANASTNPSVYTVESADITLAEATWGGSAFGGWYTEADFSGSPVTSIPTGSTGNLTLYAKWTSTTGFAAGEGTENNPYLISNAEQFANIGTLSGAMQAGTGYYFKLTGDIDLSAATAAATDYFCGTLDGGEFTITLPKRLSGSAWTILAENSMGVTVIKNLTIQHQDGEVLPFIGYANGTSIAFENVDVGKAGDTTTCTMTSGDNNESAFLAISVVSGETRFTDCSNYLNYRASHTNNYTSAFLGGYATCKSLVFENCVNYGTLSLPYASVFVGNGSQMTNTQVTVTGCYNEGKIYGSLAAMPFAAISTSSFPSDVDNDPAAYNRNGGVIETVNLDGLKAVYKLNQGVEITLPSDASAVYSLNLCYSAYGDMLDAGGQSMGTLLFNLVIPVALPESGATVTVPYGNYKLVSVDSADQDVVASVAEEDWSTLNGGTRYALIEPEDGEPYFLCDYWTYGASSGADKVTLDKTGTAVINALDEGGYILGSVNVSWNP